MNWLCWKPGRTSPFNYEKLMLFLVPSFMDCYILRFKQGSSIDWHRDPIGKDFAHHRVNFCFWRARKGGRIMSKVLILDGERKGAVKLILRHKHRFNYMRSDVVEHAVEKVEEGTCLYLSIGWCLRTKVKDCGPR